MNGNITKEGIEKDLQWMKRIGIGGVQNSDGALETPQVVDQRLIFMTPPWQDAFRYAIERAEALGLEFAIASSPGWSETGGPWVKPEDGMKKLVWSDTHVEGGGAAQGSPRSVHLAEPPSIAGPFQAMPLINILTAEEVEGPRFYRDVAVVSELQPDGGTVRYRLASSVGPNDTAAWSYDDRNGDLQSLDGAYLRLVSEKRIGAGQ